MPGKTADGEKKRMSASQRAGLQFPVARLRRYLRTSTDHQRISEGSAIFLAAVLEYLAAEILEMAGNAARDNGKTRISPRHLSLAIQHDEELCEITKGAIIPAGGVLPLPHIQRVLTLKHRPTTNEDFKLTNRF